MQNPMNSHKGRLWIIGALIAVAIALFFFVKGTAAKVVLGVVIAILAGAFGMELSQKDYDVAQLAKTHSFAASEIQRDADGNLSAASIDAFCNAQEKDYNCADFKSQPEAQQVYDRCKTLGTNMDVYHLDGDKDGIVCESLPKTARN